MDKFYPEPLWPVYLTKEQIDNGDWVSIAPDEILDYKINPLADGWQKRYAQTAIERLSAVGLPRITHSARNV